MKEKQPSTAILEQAKNELDSLERAKKQSRLIKRTVRTSIRGGVEPPPPLPQPLYGVVV